MNIDRIFSYCIRYDGMTTRGETDSDGVNKGRLHKFVTEHEGTKEVAKIKFQHQKVKVKAVCGSYSTAALRHIVLLPE